MPFQVIYNLNFLQSYQPLGVLVLTPMFTTYCPYLESISYLPLVSTPPTPTPVICERCSYVLHILFLFSWCPILIKSLKRTTSPLLLLIFQTCKSLKDSFSHQYIRDMLGFLKRWEECPLTVIVSGPLNEPCSTLDSGTCSFLNLKNFPIFFLAHLSSKCQPKH